MLNATYRRFLPRRQTFGLYRAPLTLVLTRDILICSILLKERALGQNFALQTYIVKTALGDHVPRLIRMEANVGGNAHIILMLPQAP